MDFGKDRLIPHCPLEGHIVFQIHDLQLSEDIVISSHGKMHFVDLFSVFLFVCFYQSCVDSLTHG